MPQLSSPAPPYTPPSTPLWKKALWVLLAFVAFDMFRDYERGTEPATRLMLNDRCEPEGDQAQLKEERQGVEFWRDQLDFVDKAILAPQTWMDMQSLLDSLTAPMRALTDSVAASRYASSPDLRSTAAQEMRLRADSLDVAAADSTYLHSLIRRSRALEQCRDQVAAKFGDGQ